MDEHRLRAEALRIYLRYATEVVEALGLCPWARRAREQGRVRPEVMLGADPGPDEVLAVADAVFADPRVDIGLIIFPRLGGDIRGHRDRKGFHQLMTRVRARDVERHAPATPPLVMADFHPHAEPDMTSPARLVSFVRRSPDPTIQVVRHATLEAVQGAEVRGTAYIPQGSLSLDDLPALAGVPLHQRIAEANHATIARLGVAQVQALLDDIRADRDRAYARIASETA